MGEKVICKGCEPLKQTFQKFYGKNLAPEVAEPLVNTKMALIHQRCTRGNLDIICGIDEVQTTEVQK